jgi:pimeloyl-ACP methyl ester carboxylesterase
MKKIYCISGLGADYRLFGNLSIPGYALVPLPWVPHTEKDTIPSYAMKMAQQIPGKDPIILGLSFGGMLATEIAKQMPESKAILVSGAKTRAEVGFNSTLLQRLHSAIPASWLPRPPAIIFYYLGATSAEEKTLLKDIIDHTDLAFLKWSIGAILTWNGTSAPGNILQLHGTADRVLVPANVKPDHWIKDGSHIMIYNRAEEIGKLIADYLAR